MEGPITQVLTFMSTASIYFKPSEIISIFSNALARQNEFAQVVHLKGIFHKSGIKPYGNFFYDTLKDETTNEELTIKIPQVLRDGLAEGNLVKVGGVIERNVNNKGFIQLVLAVTRVDKLQEQAVSELDQKRAEVRRLKAQNGYKNVDVLLENLLWGERKPSIAMVLPAGSITLTDFREGINAAKAFIDFKEYRINFSNSKEVCDFLTTLDTTANDAIAMVRGGGSGIEHLDHVDVLNKVASMHKPIIGAIGHPEERLFFKTIVDKECPTPQGFGQYLSDMCERVNAKKSNSKAVLVEQVKKQFQQQIEGQAKQLESQNKNIMALQKQIGEQSKQVADAKVEVEKTKNALKQAYEDNTLEIRQVREEGKMQRENLVKAVVYLSLVLAGLIGVIIWYWSEYGL